MGASVNVNLYVDDYTNRVLGVIKEKYGLKDKSQALIYLAKKHGKEYADEVVKDEYVEKILKLEKEHDSKYGIKSGMTIKQLRNLIETD